VYLTLNTTRVEKATSKLISELLLRIGLQPNSHYDVYVSALNGVTEESSNLTMQNSTVGISATTSRLTG